MKSINLYAFIAFFLFSTLMQAQKKEVQLDNGEVAHLTNGKSYTITLKGGEERKGRLLLLDDQFMISRIVPPVFKGEQKKRIEEHGVNIDGVSYEPHRLTFLYDSLLVLKSDFYEYEDIKYVNSKGKKASFTLRKVNFSMGFNGYIINPMSTVSTQYSNTLRNSGLVDTRYDKGEYWIRFIYRVQRSYSSTYEYPIVKEFVSPVDFDFSFHFNSAHGISYSYSGKSSFSGEGFKQLGISYTDFGSYTNFEGQTFREWNEHIYGVSTYFELNSNAHSLSYVHSLLNQRVNFLGGPSFNFINHNYTVQGSNNDYTVERTQTLVGVLVGCTFNFIHRKYFFMNVKTQCRWYPNLKVGPYLSEATHSNGETISADIPEISLSLNAWTAGIGFGFRF